MIPHFTEEAIKVWKSWAVRPQTTQLYDEARTQLRPSGSAVHACDPTSCCLLSTKGKYTSMSSGVERQSGVMVTKAQALLLSMPCGHWELRRSVCMHLSNDRCALLQINPKKEK